MKIQLWEDKYPKDKENEADDNGYGIVLDTVIGTIRIVENSSGELEVNSASGTLSINLMAGNTFSISLKRRM